MKILHTADLHLGRQFFTHRLAEDHAWVLEQIIVAIKDHAPDVLIIAGDIFDRAAPPESAVRQFNAFLRRVSDGSQIAIVMIAGNHDSGERIEAMSMLADGGRTLVRGALKAEEPVLVLQDEAGPVAFSALPFAYEFAARDCFEDPTITSPADVLRAQVAAARSGVPANSRWVVVAHAFVDGAATSDGERPLTRAVGGIETVPADVFDGASYVALGHLHRAQEVGRPQIRYSGSPLAFGFDEEGQEKSMTLVDLQADGHVSVEQIAFQPLRNMRTLRGTLDELLSGEGETSDDLIQIVLTDPHRRIDPVKRLRERFPNVCCLSYEGIAGAGGTPREALGAVAVENPAELVSRFLDFARGQTASAAEQAIIARELADLATADEDVAA